MDMKITMLEGEHWYGLAAVHGTKFPLNARSSYSWHPTQNYTGNQESPILLSSRGRYLWSEKPYDADIADGVILRRSRHSESGISGCIPEVFPGKRTDSAGEFLP